MRIPLRPAIGGLATLAFAAVFAALGLAPRPAAAQTLVTAASAPVTSVDPHYHTYTPNGSLDAHIFEPLLDMDVAARPVPALALSVKPVSDTVWEVKLRPGVKWHNGQDFTAEDVVYSINRAPHVPNSPGSFGIYTRSISKMEILDPLTVRLTTDTVHPMLPVDLTQLYMIWHGLGPDPLTEEFNTGKNAIGTGPFRMLSYRSGDRTEMERFDGYWGRKPYWQHVTHRVISNDASRIAALLAGDVQFAEAVPTSDAARLGNDERVTLAEVNGLRIIFLWFNHGRDVPAGVSGPNGEKLATNPFLDHRVREALSIAINRQAIVDRVMEGAAIPSAQFLPPGSYSYVPDLKPTYDPERARKLLTEAGFPHGLRITLNGPNDRYVNDGKIIQAVGQMWSRIGVQTTVEGITWSNYVARAGKFEFATFLFGWGSSTGEASNPLRSMLATVDAQRGMGVVNRGRYSNPALDKMIEQAVEIVDDAQREAALQEAERVGLRDVPIIPLHNQKNVWGLRRGLTYAARADELTRAQDVRPAP